MWQRQVLEVLLGPKNPDKNPLRAARVAAGRTLGEMARFLNISVSEYATIERRISALTKEKAE